MGIVLALTHGLVLLVHELSTRTDQSTHIRFVTARTEFARVVHIVNSCRRNGAPSSCCCLFVRVIAGTWDNLEVFVSCGRRQILQNVFTQNCLAAIRSVCSSLRRCNIRRITMTIIKRSFVFYSIQPRAAIFVSLKFRKHWSIRLGTSNSLCFIALVIISHTDSWWIIGLVSEDWWRVHHIWGHFKSLSGKGLDYTVRISLQPALLFGVCLELRRRQNISSSAICNAVIAIGASHILFGNSRRHRYSVSVRRGHCSNIEGWLILRFWRWYFLSLR